MKHVFITGYYVGADWGPVADRVDKYAKALLEDPEVTVWILGRSPGREVRIEDAQCIRDRVYSLGGRNDQIQESKFRRNFNHLDIGYHVRQMGHYRKAIDSLEGRKAIFVWSTVFAFDFACLAFFRRSMGIPVFVETNELRIGGRLNSLTEITTGNRFFHVCFDCVLAVMGLLTDLLVPFFSGTVFISSNLRRLYAWTGIPSTLIPILSDDRPAIPKPETEDFRFQMGFTGAISIQKEGLLDLVKALKWLKRETPNFVLNIYGFGYNQPQLEEYCANNDLSDNVVFHGLVPGSEIPGILARQDLLILTRPSNLQTVFGFSTKLASYLISGVPVLCTDVSDNARYLRDGESAYFAKKGNAESILHQLKRIVKNPEDRLRVGLKGREAALEHFHWKRYSKPFLDLLFPDSKRKRT
jgi:glycosyltransferase involved in cell wall biosynthesis